MPITGKRYSRASSCAVRPRRGRARRAVRPAGYPSRPAPGAGGVPAGHQSHMRCGPGRCRHPLITGDEERPCTIVAINLPRSRFLPVFSARPLEFAVSIVALRHPAHSAAVPSALCRRCRCHQGLDSAGALRGCRPEFRGAASRWPSSVGRSAHTGTAEMAVRDTSPSYLPLPVQHGSYLP